MPFAESAGLRYFQFETLPAKSFTHAVFTRQGGVSVGPFAGLNVSSSVGDEPAHVVGNMERCFAVLARPRESMFDSWLVHGTEALIAGGPRPLEWGKPPQGDIILTNKPNVTLFMRYADCVPLVYVDPVKKAVALAHAGWRGTILRVAAKAVDEMCIHFGSRPQDLLVGIGPAISVAHYEVGTEVVAQVESAFGNQAAELLPSDAGRAYFDLALANRRILEAAGVEHIEQSNLCTYANQSDWYSHRGSGGKTGRFGVLLALN